MIIMIKFIILVITGITIFAIYSGSPDNAESSDLYDAIVRTFFAFLILVLTMMIDSEWQISKYKLIASLNPEKYVIISADKLLQDPRYSGVHTEKLDFFGTFYFINKKDYKSDPELDKE